jgi:portal protein
MEIAQKHKDEFKRLKKLIEDAENYFSENKKKFIKNKKFLYESTLTDDDLNILRSQGKPELTVNIIGAIVSRLIGEWSKQAPSINVKANGNPELATQEEIVEGSLRYTFCTNDMEYTNYLTFKDSLCGYSVFKVYTDDKNEESFQQIIKIEKCYDPTLIGFDPLARKPDKNDANYSYELYPMTKNDFMNDYPDININSIKFINTENGQFSWGYNFNHEKVLYVCDFYEKKKENVMLYLISNPNNPNDPITTTKEEYDEMINNWTDITQPPIILKKKKKKITKIMRYKLIGDQLLEPPEETDYRYLPYVFVDGNSYYLTNKQMIKCYFEDAMSSQRIKNIAISTYIDQVQYLRHTDVIMAERAIPLKTEYQEAWRNPSKTTAALIYKDIDDQNNPVNPPALFQRGQLDNQLLELYNNENNTIQTTLGSYDAQLGIQDNNLSGRAIEAGAIQANSASLPYTINYNISLNQVAKIIVSLIPTIWKTETTIPIIDKHGKHSFIKINNNKNNTLDYSPNDLEVNVKPTVNFEAQKERAYRAMLELMKESQTFKDFVEVKALPVMVENIDIKGQDRILGMLEEYMAERQSQAQNKIDPMMEQIQLEKQKNQNEANKIQANLMIAQQKAEISNKELDIKHEISQQELHQAYIKLLDDLQKSKAELLIRMEEATNESERTQAELAMRQIEHEIKIIEHMNKE